MQQAMPCHAISECLQLATTPKMAPLEALAPSQSSSGCMIFWVTVSLEKNIRAAAVPLVVNGRFSSAWEYEVHNRRPHDNFLAVAVVAAAAAAAAACVGSGPPAREDLNRFVEVLCTRKFAASFIIVIVFGCCIIIGIFFFVIHPSGDRDLWSCP